MANVLKNQKKQRGTPFLSIIIPCYNAAAYLPPMLESILAQEWTDYEIIIVNDGSTDNTDNVISRYTSADDRIRYFSQPNAGVASARNLGIGKSKGEWLLFLDADDCLLQEALSLLVNSIDSDTDLVLADYITNPLTKWEPLKLKPKLTSEEVAKLIFSTYESRYWGYIWCKMFRKDITQMNNIRFVESISYNEDRLFIFDYASKMSGTCSTVNRPVYRYYLRNGAMESINGPGYWRFETDLDAFILMNSIASRFHSHEISNLIKDETYISYRKNRRLINTYAITGKQESLDRIKKKMRSRVSLYHELRYRFLRIYKKILNRH